MENVKSRDPGSEVLGLMSGFTTYLQCSYEPVTYLPLHPVLPVKWEDGEYLPQRFSED